MELERLYHYVHANEDAGIKLFQELAERLAQYWLVDQLGELLNEANTYPIERETNRLVVEYYRARLAHLKRRLSSAEEIYRVIAEAEAADPKMRAYALCDLSELLLTTWTEQNIQEAMTFAQKNLDMLRSGKVEMDSHLCQNYLNLATVYLYKGEWARVVSYLDSALRFYERENDNHGIVSVYINKKVAAANQGIWREFFLSHQQGAEFYSRSFEGKLPLLARLLGAWARAWSLAGYVAESEKNAREALAIARDFRLSIEEIGALYDLGWSLGFQDRFDEAEKCFSEGLSLSDKLGKEHLIRRAIGLSLWGVVQIRQGALQEADEKFAKALEIRDTLQDFTPRAIQEIHFWRGYCNELSNPNDAERHYIKSLEKRGYGSFYFTCATLTGLVRVHHARGEYTAIPSLLAEAEQLAQRYEYNDLLASLRLTQAHIAWEGNAPSWENGFKAALRYYQQALIYALRYNRFLLDEVLSGRPQGTPLRPIIPECLKRGEEGRKMLVALRDWWQTGANDIGTPRPDTISPIPEGIPLLEAERTARKREPGDSLPQKSVVGQIKEAL